MTAILSDSALDQLFRNARSYNDWLDKPVSEEQIHAIHDLVKMGPTSANMQPGRYIWCKSADAKARLAQYAMEANQPKIVNAPVCVIIGMDYEYHENLPWLFPHTDAKCWFDGNRPLREESAFRNGSLQGAYLMLAARALGLDAGPMSGFDQDGVNKEFFDGNPDVVSNFICSIGYGDPASIFERSPRPEFERFNASSDDESAMRTLVIDSATEACSVALFDGTECLAGDYEILGRGHAERLIPMIASLPEHGKAERILVSLGPGSFTGVRIGLAAARALGLAWQAQVVGYPTLALVAAMARAQHGNQNVTVCMTGGHGEWFVQNFDAAGLPADALASLRPDEAAAWPRSRIIAGSKAGELAVSGALALPLLPDARHAAAMPVQLLSTRLGPIYGRPPDAKLPGAAA